MPSKRDFLGSEAPFEGFHWSDFQWKRILAFFGGLGILVLYPWINPFQYVPNWVAAGFAAIPVGFVLYGATGQSWQTSMRIAVGVGIGTAIGTYFNSAGISLLL